MLNDPVFFEAAQHLAERMTTEVDGDTAVRARYGFRLAVSRYPTSTELDYLLTFYRLEKARFERDVVAAFEVTAGVSEALLHGPEQIADSLCRSLSHPAQYVSGIPSPVILLSISHPIRCSTRCLANVRVRISGPMIAL